MKINFPVKNICKILTGVCNHGDNCPITEKAQCPFHDEICEDITWKDWAAVFKDEEPAEKKPAAKRTYKEKTFTCAKCGSVFTGKCAYAQYCPDCRNAIKSEALIKFKKTMAAKNKAPVRRTDDVDMVYGNSVEL
jgi:hypothetical protein